MIKIANEPEIKVLQGPEVDELLNIVRRMYGLGAPNQYDDMGFNKMDYSNFVLQKLRNTPNGSSVPLNQIVSAMNSLFKYKKGQIPEYDNLKARIDSSVNNVGLLSEHGFANTQQGSNVILENGEDKYRNKIVTIPNLNKQTDKIKYTKIDREIKALIDPKFQAGDKFWDYNGRPAYFKAFSEAKEYGFNTFRISPKVMPDILNILKNNGYDVSKINVPATPQQQGQGNQSTGMEKPKVEATLIIENATVEVKAPYEKNVVDFMKSIPRKKMG